MTDDILRAALDRLARAVERVEGQVRRAPMPQPGLAEAYALLDERHGLLRLRVQETIERLDLLIGAGREG